MTERINLWAAQLVGRVQAVREEDGQAMVEYALILALVSVAALTILGTLGTNVSTVFQSISDAIAGA
jgi:pilus assembly protein Flp/PilA